MATWQVPFFVFFIVLSVLTRGEEQAAGGTRNETEAVSDGIAPDSGSQVELVRRLQLQLAESEGKIQQLQAELISQSTTAKADKQKLSALQRALEHAKQSPPSCDGASEHSQDGDRPFRQAPAPAPQYAHNGALRRSIASFLRKERERQRREDFARSEEAEAGPKEISIWCEAAPRVNIIPLDDEQRDMGACLTLTIGAPELDARLVLQCDGSFAPEPDEVPHGGDGASAGSEAGE